MLLNIKWLLRTVGCIVLFSGWCVGESCPQGEVADKILMHFKQEHPLGIPGADLPDPLPLMPRLDVGPVGLLHTLLWGHRRINLHQFHLHAHHFNGSLEISVPELTLTGVYEIPGLWWTTTGNFSVTLTDIHLSATITLAVLHDSCFYVTDYKNNLEVGNVSYTTDGAFNDMGMLGFLFDDIAELMINVTKPTVLEIINTNIRFALLTFLPPYSSSPTSATTTPPPVSSSSSSSTSSTSPSSTSFHTPSAVVIPSRMEQVEALKRFVRFQIPWMFGNPMLLPDVTLNILSIAELHNMSVYGLEYVTEVRHLSFDFDGETFRMTTEMLHDCVYNKHRVLWFPRSILSFSQWTEAHFGLVKHKGIVEVGRRLTRPPRLAAFTVRPVMFNPGHSSSTVQRLDRWARRLMRAVQSEFGDKMKAFLYSPIVQQINKVFSSVDTRTLLKQMVCYAASGAIY